MSRATWPWRERRAEACDDVGEAGLVGHEGVRVALDDHRGAALADGGLRPVEEVERPALVEQRRGRGVEVLRALGIRPSGALQDAAAEPRGIARGVPDREDDTCPEAVVGAVAALARRGEPCLDELGRGDLAAPLEGPAEGVPVGWRPAQLGPLDRLVAESAIAEVGQGGGTRVALRQDRVVEGDGGLHDVVKVSATSVLAGGPFVDLDAGAGGQDAQGFREGDAVAFHHEAEDVAALAAAEAVPALARGRDDEARRLLRVERAQSLERGARLLQLDGLPDDVEDGQLGLDFGCDADCQPMLLRGGNAARRRRLPGSPVRPAPSPRSLAAGHAYGRVKS